MISAPRENAVKAIDFAELNISPLSSSLLGRVPLVLDRNMWEKVIIDLINMTVSDKLSCTTRIVAYASEHLTLNKMNKRYNI
jgi:hypothetical protein